MRLADKGHNAVAALVQAAAAVQKGGVAGGSRLLQLSRIHAIWALGQITARQQTANERLTAIPALRGLAADSDSEIRAQVARVLGDARDAGSEIRRRLVGMLKDKSLRVRHLAAIALGKLGRIEAVPAVLDLLRDNDDKDAVVRHSAVMAIVGSAAHTRNGIAALTSAMNDASPAVRLGVLLTLRRVEQPLLKAFLQDPNPRLVLEAARAINDVPLDQGLPELAALIAVQPAGSPLDRDALMRRVLNANFRLGKPENAAAVARYAAKADAPETLRIEALRMLEDWAKPSSHDRVTNFWRPLPERPANVAADALRPALAGVFSAQSDKVRQAAAEVAGKLGIKEVAPALAALFGDASRTSDARVQALRALARLKAAQLDGILTAAFKDHEPSVRAEARRVLAELRPAEAIAPLTEALASGELIERQEALATLAAMKNPNADALLAAWLDKLLAGQVPPDVQLDLLDAAAKRSTPALHKQLASYEAARPHKESIDPYRESLHGGDAAAGRKLFFESTEVGCVRCHTIGGTGGRVGPDLSKIGSQKPREYILESIVDPNKVIAKGFETAVLALDDGRSLAGIVKSEDAKQLTLMTPEGKLVTVAKSSIDERSAGKSAMPQDVAKPLNKFDLRNLVEFLAGQK